MLVLERRVGERIIITVGDTEIVVSVNEALGGKAKVAVIAPKHVIVDREEIHLRKKQAAA